MKTENCPPQKLETTTKAAIAALAAATGYDAAHDFARVRNLATALVGKPVPDKVSPVHPIAKWAICGFATAIALDASLNDLKGSKWVVQKVAKAASSEPDGVVNV